MSGVQFGQQIDMNGFKITELAPGTDPTDAVNVSQLSTSTYSGFAANVGDGAATTFNVAHNLGTLDVVVGVYELATNHDVMTDVARVDANTVTVTFGFVVAVDSHRVVVLPVS
jgi:hypothetical protein